MSDYETITADQAGCWLDGAMGWHNTYRVVAIAETYGFRLNDIDQETMREFRLDSTSADVCEAAHDIADDATDYLSDLAPDGYAFEWDDGLYLVFISDDDD
jgi:hypothetical protein